MKATQTVEEGTSKIVDTKIVDTKIVVVTLIEEEAEDTQIEEAIKIGMVTLIAGLILAGSTKVEITLTADILYVVADIRIAGTR